VGAGVVALEKRSTILMTWTISTGDTKIHVRAIIDMATQQDEIRKLIAALEKRLTKENPDERTPVADV
jgi:hypothetical protein